MAESNAGTGAPTVLSVPETVNVGNVAAVMSSLAGECLACSKASAGVLVVDLSSLKDFDSTMLSMLLEMRRRAGKPLRVLNPPHKLTSLAELYGVSDLLLGKSISA
ncbi:MAG: STAS domain-containing protein [Lautropia sp.]|nr:STAS domain-containing protein [Lautropia sp.]